MLHNGASIPYLGMRIHWGHLVLADTTYTPICRVNHSSTTHSNSSPHRCACALPSPKHGSPPTSLPHLPPTTPQLQFTRPPTSFIFSLSLIYFTCYFTSTNFNCTIITIYLFYPLYYLTILTNIQISYNFNFIMSNNKY